VVSQLWLVRHAATEWSSAGRHTSHTDLPLTADGRAAARALAAALHEHPPAVVLTSPLTRARDTAALAGFADAVVDENLREWDYGELEGCTTSEIRGRGGEWADWTIWTGPIPGGETIDQVEARARGVLTVVADAPGDVLCFGHGHLLRVLTALALDLPATAGARFALDPATINLIGTEHDQRALRVWNAHS
jgi:probable phosphoglycerate mutase